jgi:cytoskeletal protein RodZ
MSIGNGSPHAEPKIGRTLELARRERGLSLHQVEQATKIRARYLWELEHENFDVLPAVYVQGSLKTYANFLGLDGEALTQELKRRQASHTATQDPAYAEHLKSHFSDRIPILLGGAAGAGGQETTGDKDVGAASVLGGNSRLYQVSGAFLVLILAAIALALTLAEDKQPAVSQVREPLISQAPPEASPVSSEKVERAPQRKDDKQDTGNKDDGSQPQQPAGSPDGKARDEGAGQTTQTGQDQDYYRPAQDPGYATATPSASPTAETAPATAEPDDTSTPPPTTEAPAQRRETGPPPAGGPTNTSPGPRDRDDFDVQVEFGSDDPVRITGNPVDD